MIPFLFDIVLTGQLRPGHDPLTVQAALARLFKISLVQSEALLGVRTLVKKGVTEASAEQYQKALEALGAEVERVKVPPTPEVAPSDTGLTLAPPGVMLIESIDVIPPVFDLSQLSLAPPGALLDERVPPPPCFIDTSALSLVDL